MSWQALAELEKRREEERVAMAGYAQESTGPRLPGFLGDLGRQYGSYLHDYHQGFRWSPLPSDPIEGIVRMEQSGPVGDVDLSPAIGAAMDLVTPIAGVMGTTAKFLPNPAARRIENELTREERWRDLDRASQRAGIARQKSTGRYVGAGPEVKSPQKKTAITSKYIDRVNAALDAGIYPGYFYASGRQALSDITDTADELRTVANLMGPTSTQVGPFQNTNYMIRALDQAQMGSPISVTLYPNSLRPTVESVMYGDDPWKGYKVDRYSNLLGAGTDRTNPLGMMPPNDQWEGFGTGLGRGQVPSGPTQVAFSDRIRADAAARINRERVAQGLEPLTLPEIQELHWAAIRAETEGRPLVLNPGDTIQGSLPLFKFQHSWEAEPGATTGMQRIIPKGEYAEEVGGILLDEAGKDRLVRSMGGRLQEPAIMGTGVYEGVASPGTQSRSFVSYTDTAGIDPASMARVDATEAARQYMLAQDARAGHIFRETASPSQTDAVDLDMGFNPDEAMTMSLQAAVDKATNGNAGVVFTEDGVRVLNFGMDNKAFKKAMQGMDVEGIVGVPVTTRYGKYGGVYGEYDWKGSKATEGFLESLESSGLPGAALRADSPETRQIAGEMADLYSRLEAEGKLTGSQKLITALQTWQTSGLDGLRALVSKGLAPAALLALFASSSGTGPLEQPSDL